MILEDLTTDEWLDLRYEEGREKRSEEIARNALAEGLSYEVIQKITGLSPDEIKM